MQYEGGDTIGNDYSRSIEQLCRLLKVDGASFDWLGQLSPSEWSRIVENAIQFGFSPLCYLRLKELDRLKDLPEKDKAHLKQNYLVARARSDQRIRDLSIAIGKLQAIEIPVIFLKGIYLCEEIYPERAARDMSDIDLMVPKDSLGKAVEELAELGYAPGRSYWNEFETGVSHQIPILIRKNHTPIELHWTLFEPKLPYHIDPEDIWKRALPFHSAEINGWKLSPEDLLLHITVHAASQHQLTGGLRFVYDTALVLQHFSGEIDWSQLKGRATAWHARAPLYLMVRLSKNIFGIGASEDFMNAIKPDQFEPAWLETAEDLLFLQLRTEHEFSRSLASFLGEGNLTSKIRLLLGRIFIPRDELVEKYGINPESRFISFYYFHHVAFLIKNHFTPLTRYLRHDQSVIRSAEKARIRKEKEMYLKNRLTH